MRLLVLLAALLAAPLCAQPTLRVADPVVAVDDRPVGADVARDTSGRLTVAVPDGTYTVSDRPFDGARLAGQFDGPLLSFVAGGRNVRLVSREPILPLTGSALAYVRFVPADGPDTAPAEATTDGPDTTPTEAASSEPPTTPAETGQPGRQPAEGVRAADRPPAGDAPRLEGQELMERLALLDQLAEAQAERDRLAAERDQLAEEIDRLRALSAEDPASRALGPEPVASLPDFDWTRLDNPDDVRQRLATVPGAAVDDAGGDVTVLFQADATGLVVRTAVPAPLDDDLDAWAEEVVAGMRFRPALVDGQPAGLRSQVVVRFER